MNEARPGRPPSPLLRGAALFNEERYWEAHEAWEQLWLVSEGDARLHLQGLIQLAAAWHHLRRGNRRGAERLFRAGLAKLEAAPSPWPELDASHALAAARALLEPSPSPPTPSPEGKPSIALRTAGTDPLDV